MRAEREEQRESKACAERMPAEPAERERRERLGMPSRERHRRASLRLHVRGELAQRLLVVLLRERARLVDEPVPGAQESERQLVVLVAVGAEAFVVAAGGEERLAHERDVATEDVVELERIASAGEPLELAGEAAAPGNARLARHRPARRSAPRRRRRSRRGDDGARDVRRPFRAPVPCRRRGTARSARPPRGPPHSEPRRVRIAAATRGVARRVRRTRRSRRPYRPSSRRRRRSPRSRSASCRLRLQCAKQAEHRVAAVQRRDDDAQLRRGHR